MSEIIKNKKNKINTFLLLISFLVIVFVGFRTGIILKLFSNANVVSSSNNFFKYEVDPNTMDGYINSLINEENGTRYAGRIWSDKTVLADTLTLDSNTDGWNGTITSSSDFLHAYSVLGSSLVDNSVETIPLDVVFVIDVSGSMGSLSGTTRGDKTTSRIYKTLTAINNGINYLMKMNSQNRVGIVVYGSYATDLLPLGHYTSKSDNEFVKLGGTWQPATGTAHAFTLTTNVSEITDKTVDNCGSNTNPQAGLYRGMQLLSNATNTVYTTTVTKTNVSRRPVLLFLSDGGTNAILNGEWYAPDVDGSGGDNKDEQHKTRFEGNVESTHTPQNGSTAILSALMTASYSKSLVEYHYRQAALDAGISDIPSLEVYSYGIDTANIRSQNNSSSADLGAWATPRLNAILDPSTYFQATDVFQYPSNLTSAAKTATEGVIANAYTQYQNWVNNQQASLQYYPKRSKTNITTLVFNQLPSEPYNGVTKEDIIRNINFVPAGHFKEVESTNIDGLFSDILSEISNSVFNPVAGGNDASVENSITYMDPIGEYMEIKNNRSININGTTTHGSDDGNSDVYNGNYDMGMLLFGKMHGLIKTAVYDYQWNDTYMKNQNNGQAGKSFIAGWYKGEPSTTNTIEGNSNVQYGGTETTPNIGSYPSANEAWNDGWVYRVPWDIAVQYVPTLNAADFNSITDAQKHIVYTLYRFLDVDAGIEQINPSYSLGKNSNSITYSLNDIRVWVEDSGTYADRSAGLFGNVGYDEALYVNIPAGALPLEVAAINVDENGEVKSYETNLNNKNESTPLRLFYAVGLQDEIMTEDGRDIDFTKISQEYIAKNRNANNGDLYFYSNYYNDSKSYNDYVTGLKSSYKYGDPLVTFSPSLSNRYYAFQKPLILYEVEEGVTSYQEKELTTVEELNNFTSSHTQVTDSSQVDSNKWYYIIIDYYKPSVNHVVYRAVTREGKELGSAIGVGDVASYVCWYNTVSNTYVDYSSQKPVGENWVVATKPSGLRVGDMAQNIKAKSLNVTKTADNYYLPTISPSTNKESIIINNYLGNNGRITVSDTALLITKNVLSTETDIPERTFNFTVKIDGKEGEQHAIIVKKHEVDGSIHWDYLIGKVEVSVDSNEGWLLTPDNSNAKVSYNGGLYYAKAIGDYSSGAVVATPCSNSSDDVQEFCVKTQYYVSTSSSSPIGGEVETKVWETAKGDDGNGEVNILADKFLTKSYFKTQAIKFGYNDSTKSEVSDVLQGWTDDEKNLPEYTANITLKDGEGLLFDGIKAGTTYTVTENLTDDDKKAGFYFESINKGKNQSNINDKTISGTINTLAEADYENIYYGTKELTIKKLVEGSEGDKTKEWSFEVTLIPQSDIILNENDFKVEIDGEVNSNIVFTKQTDNSYKAIIKLKHNQIAVIKGIRETTQYKVVETEANQGGYQTMSQDSEDTLNDNKEVLFVNSKLKRFSLNLEKEVNGEAGDKDKEWNFEIYLTPDSDVTLDKTYPYNTSNNESGFISFTKQDDGSYKGTVKIKHNDKITISNIPERTTYKVKEVEANSDGYITSSEGDLEGKFEIDDDDNVNVKFINTKYERRQLSIEKRVKGGAADEKKQWEFKIILTPADDVIFDSKYPYEIVETLQEVEGPKYGEIEFSKNDKEYTATVKLRHGEKITISNIPERTTYKVEEVEANNDGYSTTMSSECEGMLSDDKDITFTNFKMLNYDLTLKKEVKGGAGDLNKQWEFEINLTPEEGLELAESYDYESKSFIDGVESKDNGQLTLTKNEDGSYTGIVTLKHGQMIIIKNLPEGTKYKIIEKDANTDEYQTSAINDEGITDSNQEVSFVNTKLKKFNLAITKEVIGEEGDISKNWEFKITFIPAQDVKLEQKYFYSGSQTGDLELVDNNDGSYTGTVFLKHNEKITVMNIPERTKYKIEEVEANKDGYRTIVDGANEGIFNVYDDQLVKVKYTNIKYSLHKLSIEKLVEGGAGNKSKEWTFEIALKPADYVILEHSYHYTGSKTGDIEFEKNDDSYVGLVTLKHNETITIENIPENVWYSVKELEANQDEYITKTTGNLSCILEKENEKITFVNKKLSKYTLSISKNVEGNAASLDKEWAFDILLTNDDKDINLEGEYPYSGSKNGTILVKQLEDGKYKGSVSLKHNETIVIAGIPEGTSYEVEEVEANQDGYITKTTGKLSGDISSNPVLKFTNTKLLMHSITITKDVEGSVGDRDKEWNFKIIFTDSEKVKGEKFYYYDGGSTKTGVIKKNNGKLELIENEEGELVGSFTLKDGQSITIKDIPDEITYKIIEEEANLDDYITYIDGPSSGALEKDASILVTYHNKKPAKKNIVIKKKVVGNIASKNKYWNFEIRLIPDSHITLDDNYEYVGTKNGIMELIDNQDGSFTGKITLKNDEEVTILGIPEGTSYEVIEEEANQDDYLTYIEGESKGILNDDIKLLYENIKYSKTDLSITKKVKGDLTDKNKEWNFKVTLIAPYIHAFDEKYVIERKLLTNENDIDFEKLRNKDYLINENQLFNKIEIIEKDYIQFDNVNSSLYTFYVKIKADETITIKDLPYGTQYKVEELEANQDDYLTLVGNNATGVLETTETKVEFENIKYSYHSFEVEKQVNGSDVDTNKEWTMEIYLKPISDVIFDIPVEYVKEEENGLVNFVKDESGLYKGEVKIKHGEKVTLLNIPYGTEYMVVEKEANTEDYKTYYDNQNGKIIHDVYVKVINEKPLLPPYTLDNIKGLLITVVISTFIFLVSMFIYKKKLLN